LSAGSGNTQYSIIKLTELCDTSCGGDCETLAPCGGCPANFILGGTGVCEIQCNTGEFSNSNYDACIPCDPCCTNCGFTSSLTRPYIPVIEDLVCFDTLVGVLFKNNACTPIESGDPAEPTNTLLPIIKHSVNRDKSKLILSFNT
jgi:hypothetical protein